MTTRKLENVIQTVHTMSADYFDETIPLTDMEFDSAKNMWISDKLNIQSKALGMAQKSPFP